MDKIPEPQFQKDDTQQKKGRRIKVLFIYKDRHARSWLEKVTGPGTAISMEIGLADSLKKARRLAEASAPDVILIDWAAAKKGKEKILQELGAPCAGLSAVVWAPAAREAEAARFLPGGADDYMVWERTGAEEFEHTLLPAAQLGRLRRELESSAAQLKEARRHLETLTFQDPQTGLFNRSGLQQAMSLELKWVRRDNEDLLVLLANLDGFDAVNGVLGRAGGDWILNEVAGRLKSVVRTTDYVGRIGADQFMILLPENRLAEGIRIAAQICRIVSKTPMVMPGGERIKISMRLALVMASPLTPSIDELLAKIPILKFHWDGKKIRQSFSNRESWSLRGRTQNDCSGVLRMLKNEKSLHAVKQPIVNLEDSAVVGYEFLSRSKMKDFQMPENFFRACMEDNMLTLVDHQCLKTCVAASMSVPGHMSCHINLFPSTIIDIPAEHLLETLRFREGRTGFCVEISEQQIIGDPSYLSHPVEVFKRSGLRIAIDDVGFGRSCLESLILLEPDVVKIDKKCISGIACDRPRIQSLKRLLKIAEVLGAEVVAEGIESAEDLELVKSLGVKYGQGFFLGRPA